MHAYDWRTALGDVPEGSGPNGGRPGSHPLVRALAHPELRARAIEVLQRCVVACEGLAAELVRVLGCSRPTVRRLLVETGLSAMAGEVRKQTGHVVGIVLPPRTADDLTRTPRRPLRHEGWRPDR